MCTVYTSFSLLTKTIICDIFVDVPVTLFIANCHHFSVWKGVHVLNTLGMMKMCFVFEHFGFDENVLCL